MLKLRMYRFNFPVLILAGINNSGPTHWQSLWQQKNPNFFKVEHRDWDSPVCSDWVDDLECVVIRTCPDTVLVAHSLGCLLVAHWSAQSSLQVKAGMLVSVPDPSAPMFPREAKGFNNVPMTRLGFPSVVVASTDDPYGSPDFMRHCAAQWGSRFVSVGAYGHINAESGLGDWPEGYSLLASMCSS
jgi:predicted alpha/beta hydrolase family esterase